MKFEIIHLSDFHIKNEFDYNYLIDRMIDSLIFEDVNVDSRIFLCITGDLTQSGQKSQFKLFDSFLQKLKERMGAYNKTLEILFVPGNHDIQLSFNDSDNRSNKIREALDNKNINELLESDINSMNPFFSFARKYDVFLDNKFVCEKKYNLYGHEITFVLINTACFSSIKKNDKDMHYVPLSEIDKIDLDRDIITLMHHNFEWFDESCQNSVEKLCKESMFYLFGHNHKVDIIQFEKGKGFLNKEINYNKLNDSAYSIIILDSEENRLELYKVEYDKTEKKFIRKEEDKKIFFNILHDKNLNYNHKFKNENSKIDINGKEYSLDNFFVMPLLTIKNNKEIINDFDKLIEWVEEKKFISLDGSFGRGKTTLVKKIFNKFIEKDKMVLFLNNESLVTNNFNQSIKNIFKNNYPERQFDAFTQQLIRNKVLIIDDINIAKNEKIINFVNEGKKQFEIVIFTNDGTFDSRKEFLSENLFIEVEKLRIEPYALKQRRELVEKFAKYYEQDDKVDLINKCIESILIDETFVDLASPDNLVVLIQRIIEDKLYEERDMKDSFSIVFEKNILNKIDTITGEEKVEDAFTILRELAYFMFCKEKEKCYKISTSEIVSLIETCRKEWGVKFEISKFLLFLENSGLMKKDDESYSFVKNSYFAFFIAKGIIERKNNGIDINEDLQKLIVNISFGNYSDILLFIAYFLNSYMFFDKIMSILNGTTLNWKEISYDENNHYILKRVIKDGLSLKDNYENKEEHNKRRDFQERKYLAKVETQKEETKYSPEILNSEMNDIIKTTKLLEILSKGLGGYKGKIKVLQRQKMLDTIVEGLYKLIYKIFDLTDEDYESFYRDITINIKEKNGEITSKEIEKQITNILYDTISTFTLNLLTSMSKIFVSKNSIDLIDELSDYDNNGNINFNTVLLKCISFERYGNEEKFVNYLYDIYDELKTHDQKRMIRRVFYLFVITNNLSYQNLERICKKLNLKKDKIFLLNSNTQKAISMLPRLIKS